MHARLTLVPPLSTAPVRRLPSRRTLAAMTIATVIAFAYVGYDETTSRADAPPAAVQPTGATSIALVSAGAGR